MIRILSGLMAGIDLGVGMATALALDTVLGGA